MTVANVDVELVVDDGTRWGATLISLSEIGEIMRSWKATGKCFDGGYFHCSDLVILDDQGLAEMTRVLGELVRSGEYHIYRHISISKGSSYALAVPDAGDQIMERSRDVRDSRLSGPVAVIVTARSVHDGHHSGAAGVGGGAVRCRVPAWSAGCSASTRAGRPCGRT